MTNALAHESSPYLRQHAENPVEWLPWGEAAFARARAEQKPILLSVGYAACHWCHVMAHESFEDAATAAVMNALFVNVKVDREERPDVDAIYMRAVQALTGRGGWPMTVFLTPEGRPFYGGTYYPPEDRHGLPGFRRVLQSVHQAWTLRRDDVQRGADALMAIYQTDDDGEASALRNDTVAAAIAAATRLFDARHGGFGGAPKFPPTMVLDVLLRQWARTGDDALLHMVRQTWRRMARGGLYDQIGGGFHRYTVDDEWLVPHFEKMLYDNALLVRLGAHLWQATGDPEVRRVTEQTLAWLSREMTSPDGGWYASLDADSEGHEGAFYVWSLEALHDALGEDAELLSAYWGASAAGNFEGKNILWTPRDAAEFADRRGVSLDAVRHATERGAAALLSARAQRARPARDEKIIASWNGLMLRGVAECARAFDLPAVRDAAVRAGAFLWEHLVVDGRVRRAWTHGVAAVPGVLEDYAALGLGFAALYELTADTTWLERARRMSDGCTQLFLDGVTFYDTANDAELLVTRPREVTDNAMPAGTSLAVELDLVLFALDGDPERATRAERVLAALQDGMRRHPLAFGHLLGCADLAHHGAVSVALCGDDAQRAPFARALASVYVPGLVIAAGTDDRDVPLLRGKCEAGAAPIAFVCHDFACDAPATAPETLTQQLRAAVRE